MLISRLTIKSLAQLIVVAISLYPLNVYAQDAGPKTETSWPKLPFVIFRDYDVRNHLQVKQLSFTSVEKTWPQSYLIFQSNHLVEELDGWANYTGKIAHITGFWDAKTNPAQVITWFSLYAAQRGTTSNIYYKLSTPYVFMLANRPRFSPDGNKLLFNDQPLRPERFEPSGMYLWDFNKGAVKLPIGPNPKTEQVYYPEIRWSPGSRYLSYLRGGNAFGDYDQWTKPYRLFLYDIRSDTDREVASYAAPHWSWTHQASVLFARVQPQDALPVAARNVRPSIYEAQARTLQTQKLFDGGYFAQASPDNQWIAFCDWPGPLTDNPKAAPALQKNTQRGLFLWHRATQSRVFVGPLALAGPPHLQWAPDGRNLYVLEAQQDGATLRGTLWKMEIAQQTLNKLSEVVFTAGEDWKKVGKPGFFSLRGTSANGATLYVESVAVTDAPKGYANTRRTLIAVDTQSGAQTPMARLTNRAGDQEWDWHDDSGPNPALVAAQKLENALPVWTPPPSAAKPKAAAKPQPKTKKTPAR